MAVTADTSDLQRFVTDLQGVPTSTVPKIRAVVSRAALNIKNQQRAEMETSLTFKGIAKTISYDLRETRGAIEAEVGPNRHFRHARLANIAYFEAETQRRAVLGSSTAGGVVPDPSVALEAEMPRMLDALGDVLGRVLRP